MFPKAALVLASLLFSLAIVKTIDSFLLDKRTIIFGGYYEALESLTANHKDIYPYTGGHTQANYSVGPNFVTGDHGFMVSFDLDNPPPKSAGEFRLIWTGGSGAAGWGASKNEAFISSVIEKEFSQKAECRDVISLKVINLAMGDSQSFQNFIALNRWGHKLEPDMIVSYSGFNDVNVPWFTMSDAYRDFEVISAYNRMARYSESPVWLKYLGRVLPGLIRGSSLSVAIRSLNIRQESEEVARDYRSFYPHVAKTPQDVLNKLVIPNYVHALQSIKRDFGGLPVVVAYQPYGLTKSNPLFLEAIDNPDSAQVQFNKKFRMDLAIGTEDYLKIYRTFISETEAKLKKYENNEWLFLNPHKFLRTQLLGKYNLRDGIHYDDEVQRAIALNMSPKLFAFICSQI